MRRLFGWSLTLLACLSCQATRADVVSVNFSNGSYNLAPSTSAGLVTATNWNNVSATSGSVNSLMNNFGATTNISISNITGTNFVMYGTNTGLNTSDAGLNTVYKAGYNGNSATVSFSNIPYAFYDVYVYAAANSATTGHTLNVSDGTTTFFYKDGNTLSGQTSLTRITATTSGAAVVNAATYALFSNKTGSSLSISMGGGITSVVGNNLYGIQIVSVPEPGTLLLGAIAAASGGTGLWWKRRKKPAQSTPETDSPTT